MSTVVQQSDGTLRLASTSGSISSFGSRSLTNISMTSSQILSRTLPRAVSRTENLNVRVNVATTTRQHVRRLNMVHNIGHAFAFTQIITSICVLGVSWNRPCEAPLRLWLLVHAFRVLFAEITTIAIQRHMARVRPEAPNAAAARRLIWLDRIASAIEIFGFSWFVVGNWWASGSRECSSTAPLLYGLIIAWLVWGYLYICLPFLLLAMVVCCLPCFLVGLRNIDQQRGATDEVISEATTTTKFQVGMYGEEDAQCSICLGQYENDEELRILRCKHHFHQTCVDQWLHINKVCPLCVQSITKEEEADATSQRGEITV
eukprot:Colp12_sorted_trinity150504_noHs@1097